jgi:hypothetical protein
MSRVMTFSRTYPAYHPKAGQPTHFVEKVIQSLDLPDYKKSTLIDLYAEKIPSTEEQFLSGAGNPLYPHMPKHHTIRAGHRWKVGDWFSPRVWGNDINPKTGKIGPYHSKMIAFAPDIQVKKVWDFSIILGAICIGDWHMSGEHEGHHEMVERLAENDGLEKSDLITWFKYPKPFDGQIICWNESIKY